MWLCAHFADMQIEAKLSHVRVRGGGKGGGGSVPTYMCTFVKLVFPNILCHRRRNRGGLRGLSPPLQL